MALKGWSIIDQGFQRMAKGQVRQRVMYLEEYHPGQELQYGGP